MKYREQIRLTQSDTVYMIQLHNQFYETHKVSYFNPVTTAIIFLSVLRNPSLYEFLNTRARLTTLSILEIDRIR